MKKILFLLLCPYYLLAQKTLEKPSFICIDSSASETRLFAKQYEKLLEGYLFVGKDSSMNTSSPGVIFNYANIDGNELKIKFGFTAPTLDPYKQTPSQKNIISISVTGAFEVMVKFFNDYFNENLSPAVIKSKQLLSGPVLYADGKIWYTFQKSTESSYMNWWTLYIQMNDVKPTSR